MRKVLRIYGMIKIMIPLMSFEILMRLIWISAMFVNCLPYATGAPELHIWRLKALEVHPLLPVRRRAGKNTSCHRNNRPVHKPVHHAV